MIHLFGWFVSLGLFVCSSHEEADHRVENELYFLLLLLFGWLAQ